MIGSWSQRGRPRVLLALTGLYLLMPSTLYAAACRGREVAFVKGVALGHYTDITEAQLDEKLQEVRELGASYVSLVVSWSTPDVRASQIAPRADYSTPDAVLARMIRRARARSLQVLLFPIIDVEQRKPLEWRGTLKPSSWDAWWRSYRRFILHYAALASRHGVEMFCVGSELVGTEHMRGRWQDLIGRVRELYRGTLIYSANWDHYEPVSFWDLVDCVGLTAYYQIAQGHEETQTQMAKAWRAVRDKLVRWSKSIKRPLIFTEVGYPSADGCAVHPWDYTVNAPPDPEEQRRAFGAFVQTWEGVPQLGGVFFWDWYGDGGPTDTRYTPRGKPAQAVIRGWFQLGPRVHK